MKFMYKRVFMVVLIIMFLISACATNGSNNNSGTTNNNDSTTTSSEQTENAQSGDEQTVAAQTDGDSSNDGQAQDDSVGAAGAAETESDAPPPELEEIIMTFGIDSNMEDGVHYQFSVLNELAAQTGVRFDFIQVERDKFRVLAAGQDLPDIFITEMSVPSLVTNKTLYPLNDLIAEYAPNVAQYYDMSIRYQTYLFGDTYCFPYDIYDEPPERHLPVRNGGSIKARYDLYKEIGSPEITDKWDGFFDVMEQMQTYARDKYQNENIYAFSSWVDWGVWPFICVYPFSNGYGDLYEVNQMVHVETNELQDNFLDADGVFWEGVEWMRDAYSRGLFDPEGLTQSYTQYTEKVTTGQVISTFASWLTPNEELMLEGAAFVILPNSVGKVLDLTPRLLPMGNRFSGALAVNANYEHADRFMQMMEWTNSTEGKRLMANGVRGETWDYIDGVPQYIGIFKDEYLYGPDWREYFNVYPAGIYGTSSFSMLRTFGSNGPNGYADDGYPYFLMNQPEFVALTADKAERAFAEDYGFTYPGEVYMQWVKEGKLDYSPVYLTMPAQVFSISDEDIIVAVSRAQQYFEANVGRVIMSPTKEAFETEKAAIIDHLINVMGYDEVSAAIAQQFEEANELVSQFME